MSDRYTPFNCSTCRVTFALERADNSWDEELTYDVWQWLANCTDRHAIERAAPGRCKSLAPSLHERGC